MALGRTGRVLNRDGRWASLLGFVKGELLMGVVAEGAWQLSREVVKGGCARGGLFQGVVNRGCYWGLVRGVANGGC